jgi:hypothetical protein
VLKDYVEVRHDGAETIDIGTVLVGGADLAGTVRDATDGRPLPGVKVQILDPVVYAAVVTDAEGRYAFRNLTASVYEVSFRKPGYGTRDLRDIEIEAGAAKPVDVELTPGAILDVFVRDTDDRPVAGPVGLSVRPGAGGDLDLDDEGHARYTGLLPGRYTLSIRRIDLEGAWASVELRPGANTVRLRVQRRPYTWGQRRAVGPRYGAQRAHGTAGARRARERAARRGVHGCGRRVRVVRPRRGGTPGAPDAGEVRGRVGARHGPQRRSRTRA